MAPRDEAFSRRHRFTAQGAFAPALRSARKLRGQHAVLHVARSPSRDSRLGIALTRRFVPSAVARNRLKRLLREAFRRHAVKGLGLDCVVTLRAPPGRDAERAIVDEVRALFDQLCPTA
jgi:ribonuclease P protein component